MAGLTVYNIVLVAGISVAERLYSAPYNISTKQPPRQVKPTCMKIGTHMYHARAHKKSLSSALEVAAWW